MGRLIVCILIQESTCVQLIYTASYTASKGAIASLTRQVSQDYGKQKIHCNAICPERMCTYMSSAAKALLTDNSLVIQTAIFHISSQQPGVTGIGGQSATSGWTG